VPDYDDDPYGGHSQPSPLTNACGGSRQEDCSDWFKAEVSNVVLSAWADYPAILQVSHAKPFSDASSSETVDVSYTVTHLNRKVPAVVGEWKRNLSDN
jgi:hypothetical protein